MAEAVRWEKRGARINSISPGIIMTPLANDELKGPLAKDTDALSKFPRLGVSALKNSEFRVFVTYFASFHIGRRRIRCLRLFYIPKHPWRIALRFPPIR